MDRKNERGVKAVIWSLISGLVTFFIVGIAITALLEPYIWPSLMVGLIGGVLTGFTTIIAIYHHYPEIRKRLNKTPSKSDR